MLSSKDSDPHGVQKLLALLRAQQDRSVVSSAPTTTQQLHPGSITSSGSATAATFDNALSSKLQPDNDDLRYISFAQALPHLTRLSKDEAFLAALLRMKGEQDQYEEMLRGERVAFSERKGGGPSSQSALTSWDREALRRWDNLHSEQQKRLQSWGVPCFFETKDPSQLKKQERVFDVLHGLLE